MSTVQWSDLGRLDYGSAWSLQRSLVEAHKTDPEGTPDRLLLVEHDPVITVGRRAELGTAHIVATPAQLERRDISIYPVERGGDVTYHGPGQLVLYPVLDLHRHRRDVRWYSDSLLAVIVQVLAAFGIAAEARTGCETGVWVADGGSGTNGGSAGLPPGKIAALGVRIERWITYHGVALNVNTDLGDFALIVPCGLDGVRVTSMAEVLGHTVDFAAVKDAARVAFARVFGVELVSDVLALNEESVT